MEYNKVLLEALPFSMHDALDDALEIVAGAADKKKYVTLTQARTCTRTVHMQYSHTRRTRA